MSPLLQTSIKLIKSVIFFTLILILFYLLLGNRFKYAPFTQTFIALTLTYSFYFFTSILIFNSKFKNSLLRLIGYLLLGIPLHVFFIEAVSLISDIYAFNSDSQDYLIKKYQTTSAFDYAWLHFGKKTFYYLKNPWELFLESSIFTSITLISGIFLELNWRREKLNRSSNLIFNYLLFILLFTPSLTSSFQLSLDFFESSFKTALYLLSNMSISGILIYQIFVRLHQKNYQWLPIFPYFISGIFLSIVIAYLWHFAIPVREYGNEPFGLLALIGQGWLQALIWLYIFNVYASKHSEPLKSIKNQID